MRIILLETDHRTAVWGFYARLVFSLLVAVCLAAPATAQTIKVYRANGSLTNNETVAFPTAGKGPSFLVFTIQNTGTTTLNLSGTPVVQVSGTSASEFVVSQPASTSLAAGANTTFKVTYTPSVTTTGISNAQLKIASNDATTPSFQVNLKGGGNLFYGAKWPPVDGGTYQLSASTNEAGRTGGRTLTLGMVSLAGKTSTWWGTSIDSAGILQLKLSLDGSTYESNEVFTYSPSESNLANGKAVWRATTRIYNAIFNTWVTVYTRATLTTKNTDNSIRAMVDPLSLGLSEQVGGIVKFNSATEYILANYFIEASTSSGSGFQPYLDFYDAYPTPPGPLPGAGIGNAYSSVNHGTYWTNLPPRLTNNQVLDVNEGAAKVITTAYLTATDDEDIKLNASPESIVFAFKSNTTNSNPMVFNHGVLKRNGATLSKTDSFTLKDIQDGIITYQHDGSESVYDEFQFSIKDSKKVLASDGGFSVYNFKIQITPVNDAPVTQNVTYTSSYAVPLKDTLRATDPDNTNLTFSVVTPPSIGTVVVNADGSFTYTPTGATAGTTVTFTYRAYDGTAYSNTSTVTITLVNMPPLTQKATYRTLEDRSVSGLLIATDPEGSAVTFLADKLPAKGTVTVAANGAFTYQPSLSRFGTDYFTFRASDALGNASAPDTVYIHVIPRMDEGDVLIADKDRVHLYDPVTGQDTLLSKGGGLAQAQNLYYKKNTSLFVLDQQNGLIKINPYTGSQSLVAAVSNFNSNPGPLGIIMDQSGNLVIADGPNGIKKVDTATGAIQTLFSGGSIQFPTGVVYLNNGDLLISDGGIFAGGASKIIRVQPNGSQTVVSTGNLITLPVDLALVDQNTIIVADGGAMAGGTDRIYKVDLTTGVQTLVSVGDKLAFPSGLDYYNKLNKLYVVNQMNARLLDVDPSAGSQTTLPLASSPLVQPFGLMVIASATRVTSVNVPADSTYIIGQQMEFAVNFSDNVTVNTAGGSPTLSLLIGSTPVSATYVSGSGTTALVFRYTVQQGDLDGDGISVTALQLNGSTITASGADADIILINVGATAGVMVDGVPPTVVSITRQNPSSAVTNANTVVFRVTFSESVKGVSATSFILTTAGANGTVASVSAATGSSIDVTITGVTGPGTMRLDLKSSGTGISDIPGNSIASGFTGGETYTINNAPVFTSSVSSLSVCRNAAAAGLGALLTVSDLDNGQTLTWTVVTPPAHGMLNGFPATGASNGGSVTPGNLMFTPATGYNGADAFEVQVSDGISTASFTVNVIAVQPVAGFTVNNATQCLSGNSVVFTNTSTVNAGSLNYTWTFGDGSNATAGNPTHSYAVAGAYTVKLVVTSDNGCKDSTEQVVTIAPMPAASFTINTTSQCLNGNMFSFNSTATVAGGSLTYSWTFGDGNSSNLLNPTHAYTTAGTYTVKLVVTSGSGCKDSVSQLITVYPVPVPSFAVNNAGQCVNGNAFSFTNTSTIATGTLMYNWSFGDGNSSTAASPSHSYTTAGNYVVKLVVTSDNGCKDSVTQSVVVYPKPAPSFTVNTAGQCVNGNSFVFSNTSAITTGSSSFSWTFGDGNSSTDTNPTHVYANAGSFKVKLVAISDNGCTDSIEQMVTVYPKPVPAFAINSNAQCVNGNSFTLTNTSSISAGSVTYQWAFGDGNSSTAVSPVHVYTAAGTYTIKLVVTSDNGCKDSISQSVTVYPKPQPSFTINTGAQCVSGNSFSFTNTSVIASGTLSYLWRFDDGSTSTTQNPAHTYAAAGTYNVTLVVTSDNGCMDSVRQQVTVYPKPEPSFTINNAAQCFVGNSFSFTNTSTITSGTLTAQWFFGDNTTGTGNNPVHTYAIAGTYTVKLVVTSGNGCKDSIMKDVVVYPAPTAAFIPNAPGQCLTGNSFNFTNTSTVSSGAATYQWTFGDGNNSTFTSPSHSYAAAGPYIVKLVVTASNGCMDSISKPVTVYPKPAASFGVNSADQCINVNAYSFTNTSAVSSGSMTYQWSFGDGGQSLQTNAAHNYTAIGSYTVKLVATSDNGCTDTVSSVVMVHPQPVAGFTVNTPSQCLRGNDFGFTNTSSLGSTYTWSFGDAARSNAANPSHSYTVAGTYVVKLVAISNMGCVSDTAAKGIEVYPQPLVNAGVDKAVLEGRSIVLQPTVSGATGTFLWTPSLYLNTDTVLNPVSTPADDIVYNLTVTTVNGCSTSDEVMIRVLRKPELPNVFSPNGDGINDTWKIRYLEQYPGATVDIFNRNGQPVFSSKGYSKPWDGTYKGSPLPVGVYYYVIDPKNGREKMSGSITILR